jgi:hypothetical protein
MALRSCKECKKEVSTDAKACPHCGKQNPTSAVGSPLLLGCLAIIVIGVVSSLVSKPSSPRPSPVTTTAQPPRDTIAERQRRERWQADSTVMEDSLKSLKRSFRFAADSIEGGGWYSHRNQTVDNSWNRTYLAVNVADDGRSYLISHYTGDNWIFHDKIVVRIGDRILRSAVIPSYSDLNVRNNSGGQVWEYLHFTGGQDNGIMEAIAATADTPAVRVRFEGDEHLKDIVLSSRDRVAIRDAYRLGSLIKRLRGPH